MISRLLKSPRKNLGVVWRYRKLSFDVVNQSHLNNDGFSRCLNKGCQGYEKRKFKNEGILRKCIYKNGHYLNEIIMSILKSEHIDQ